MEQIQKYAPSAFAGQAHESRSSRYTFLPTSDVISGLHEAGFNVVQAVQSRSRIEGKELFTRHMLRFRANNAADVMSVGDSTVEALMKNSHDGTSMYEIMLGVFRMVCGNGLVIAESTFESIKVRHTGNIVEEVIKATQRVVSMAPIVTETIKLWKTIILSPAEQQFLAEGALNLRYDSEQAPVLASTLLSSNRYVDNGDDLYTVFNRVQENTIRGGERYRQPESGRRMRTREVKGIDQNTRPNRELWALAEKMAALKSGNDPCSLGRAKNNS